MLNFYISNKTNRNFCFHFTDLVFSIKPATLYLFLVPTG